MTIQIHFQHLKFCMVLFQRENTLFILSCNLYNYYLLMSWSYFIPNSRTWLQRVCKSIIMLMGISLQFSYMCLSGPSHNLSSEIYGINLVLDKHVHVMTATQEQLFQGMCMSLCINAASMPLNSREYFVSVYTHP